MFVFVLFVSASRSLVFLWKKNTHPSYCVFVFVNTHPSYCVFVFVLFVSSCVSLVAVRKNGLWTS